MNNTKLYILTEKSPFMMSFVYLTAGGRAVVVDGGRPEDLPQLFALIDNRPIAAWLLTHPHYDHISGLVSELEHGEHMNLIQQIYHHFPSAEFARRCEPNGEPTVAEFDHAVKMYPNLVTRVQPGDRITVDELTVEVLFCGGERYEMPKPHLAVNESSGVYRVTSPGLRSVLFLGDLGPAGGRDLLLSCGDSLRSDVVQMAHHGHSGVGFDVYKAIAPEACLWCAPEWLWNEDDVELEPELWGTMHQRAWMEKLGVTEHYVSKDGVQEIPLVRHEIGRGRNSGHMRCMGRCIKSKESS